MMNLNMTIENEYTYLLIIIFNVIEIHDGGGRRDVF